MKFSEAKSLIKSGDLIACSHQPWVTISDIESHIVRMACESEFSHVAVVIDVIKDSPHILEAVVPEVVISPIEKYLEDGFFWLPLGVPVSDEEKSYGLSKVGQKYSKLEAVAGFMDLLDIGGDEFWQCSELTISMRKRSGVSLGPHATPAAVVQKALLQGSTLTYVTKD
jgi:hypothetical protein